MVHRLTPRPAPSVRQARLYPDARTHHCPFRRNVQKLSRRLNQEALLDKALQLLTALKVQGVDTMVDLTVLGLGRDVPLLLPVVEQTGIQAYRRHGSLHFQRSPDLFPESRGG